MPSASERIAKFIDTSTDCWLWTGRVNEKGYGQITVDGKKYQAHRFSYVTNVGPIPDGMKVLHRCDVRNCVRPDHLFLGDDYDNMRDMVAKGRHAAQKRTHCRNGHEYTPENTAFDRGARRCKECRKT